MNKFQLYCSCLICKLPTTIQNLHRHYATHNYTSKNCLECHEILSNVENKFCSKSCSAKYSNRNRVSNRYIQKYSIPIKTKAPYISTAKLKKRTCISCGKTDELLHGRFQSEYCKYCNPSLTYRDSCNFTFDLRKYPNEFDLELLSKYGMFHPKTNRTGVSRDHKISISFGKNNRIPPEIMKHPANCTLMLHSNNKAKQHYSSITLEELLEAIKQWDLKYPNPSKV